MSGVKHLFCNTHNLNNKHLFCNNTDLGQSLKIGRRDNFSHDLYNHKKHHQSHQQIELFWMRCTRLLQ